MDGVTSRIKHKLARIGRISFEGRRRAVVRELDARNAYRLWAPTYVTETATSFLDDEMAREMLSGLPFAQLLDAGCGTGRRIAGIPGAVGMDASPEMLAIGGARHVVVGDVRKMPFDSDRFDMVWCRLVLGHLPDAHPAYRELARVCKPGGYVFVTDFHPDAAAAGQQRTFTDHEGTVHGIEHYLHDNHKDLAAQSGLSLVAQRDGAVGPSILDFYARGIGMKAYKRDLGLNLIAAYLFRKPER